MHEGSIDEKRSRWSWLRAAVLLLLVLFQLATARLGIDYGKYWDEHFLQSLLSDGVNELDAWPRKYFYGSLYSALGYLAIAPEWIESLPALAAAAHEIAQYDGRLQPTPRIREIQDRLLDEIHGTPFLIRARTVFAVAATLGIPFLYLAGRRFGRTAWGGVLAAAVLGLSWEFNTHSRHIAIDGVFVALVALFLATIARALEPAPVGGRAERWLYLAALECGLATGAKFHGMLLLLPLTAILWSRADVPRRARAVQTGLCFALAGIAMLVVNPGLVFDTAQVANDWGYTQYDYWRDSDPRFDSYKASGGLAHLREATAYAGVAALSPYAWLGLLLLGTAAVGFVARWRRDWKTTLALGGFVPFYLFVMSRSGLVLARNYLPVLPFLALFVAGGIETLWLRGGWMRRFAATLCLVWVAFNGFHIFSTALSVRRSFDGIVLVADVRSYLADHHDERFLLSRGLDAMAARVGAPLVDLPNVRASLSAEGFDRFVYLASDFPSQVPGELKLGYFEKVFGSREVNFDYYPNWIGHGLDHRVYVIDRDKAEKLLEMISR